MMEKWNKDELLFQAAEYFKRPGFRRLFEGLKERYQSLSRLGGTIRLNTLTEEEALDLEGFLQRNMPVGSKVSLSVSQIRKALGNTRYDQCSLEEIVPLVLEERMISNKEEQVRQGQELQEFFERTLESCQGTPAEAWLSRSLSKRNPLHTLLIKDYNRNKQWLGENIPLIIHAVNSLPAQAGEYLRLPVFSAAVTGNPHYFDEGKGSLKYLLYGIRDLFGEVGMEGDSIEARTELLYKGGILKDDLYNWVLSFGIRGYVGRREPHKGMEEYFKRGEPQILTLQNLSLLKSADAAGKKVYVVENPSVFSQIVSRKLKGHACICSGGQLRLSVLILLDLLVKNHTTVYYSGDFDPEGLCIAQKLVSRYGERLKLWCYDEKIYFESISAESISDRRLKQLKGLTDCRLSAIGKLLQEYRRPGYQENIMDYFI